MKYFIDHQQFLDIHNDRTLKSTDFKGLQKSDKPANRGFLNFEILKSTIFNSKTFIINNFLYVAFLLFILQGCDKSKCKDNPCADGCDGCPKICKTDPCGNPVDCPGLCPSLEDGILSKQNFIGEGIVVETDNGMSVDGKLTISTLGNEKIILEDAKISIEYNDDGSVKNMEGTTKIPSPTNYMEFSDPIEADLGYFSGKYLNDNWDLDIMLIDERFYLAFKIAVALELKIGTNSDPNATKPFSIKPPVGGHILYIFDYTDPFYFYSAAQDLLGSLCFGESRLGNIPYVPLQPVDEIVTFDGNSVRCGSFPIFKVIEVSGTMIQGTEFNLELIEEDPFPITFSAGYGAGINGEFNLTLPISNWINFEIPLGEASAAITVEAGTNGIKAQAFINGLAKPDNSWWPDFIPVKPGGQLRTAGYVEQSGKFDLELSGELNLELPANTYAIEGSLGATNESFTMGGSVLASGWKWAAAAEFHKNKTEFSAKPPQELLNNINSLVNANIDSAFDKAEKALADIEKATENYEIELSLRGLRELIPAIVTEAKKQIKNEIDAGVKSGKSQASAILKKYGGKLCSDNIKSQVNKVDDAYIKALNRLNNAVKSSNDNETTRKELAASLRALAKLKTLKKSTTVTVWTGNVVTGCLVTTSYKRTVKIDVMVLTNKQVELLNTAADNVKYISEASNIKIAAQEIFDRIPAKEIMETLKNDIAEGTKIIPDIGEVGFINHHAKNEYSFYLVIGGKKKDLSDINIFDPNSIAEAIIGDML